MSFRFRLSLAHEKMNGWKWKKKLHQANGFTAWTDDGVIECCVFFGLVECFQLKLFSDDKEKIWKKKKKTAKIIAVVLIVSAGVKVVFFVFFLQNFVSMPVSQNVPNYDFRFGYSIFQPISK